MKAKIYISIVIGSYNRYKFLKLLVNNLRHELDGTGNEIIIVDGGSTDGTLEWLVKQKDIITIVQHNRGEWLGKEIKRKSWGYFINLGFKIAKGKYICMLSDDCLVVPGAIKNGIKLFDSKLDKGKKVGAVAFYWRNWPEQKKYWVGLTLGKKMFVNHGLFLNKALREVGYADEENYSFYHADGDLSLKLWEKGYKIIDSDNSYVEHYSHANDKIRDSNLEKQKQDWRSYLNKWSDKYLKSEDKYEGGWIKREYFDNCNTASKFLNKLSLSKRMSIKIKSKPENIKI